MTAMHTTHYGLYFQEYAVEYNRVDETDNAGAPCDYCQLDTATNDRTVYGVDRDGQPWSVDCCGCCVPRLVCDYADASYDVTVELMGGAAMHGPDCMCLHPDAL